MRVAIVSFGTLPVPAVKGGAVENLIENIVKVKQKNEDDLDLTVYSIKNDEAMFKSKQKYSATNFIFINTSRFIRIIDLLIYKLMKLFFSKKKTMSYRYIMQRINFIRKVGKSINKNDYDLIIFENHVTLFRVLDYKNNFNKYKGKYCYHIHNEISKSFGSYKYMLECPLYLGVSEYINVSVSKYLGKKDNFQILKNCINQNYFNKELKEEEKNRLLKKLKIPLNAKIILFTGRICREKGIVELLSAFNEIEDENIYLIIVGSQYFNSDVKSKFELELQELANKKKDKIIFTGFVNYSDIWKFYKLCNIVVLPSMWNEPCALTVVESIVTNCLLITTYSGGIPEYVDESCAILLNRDDNIKLNIKEAILNLLKNEDKYEIFKKNMKKKARDITIENYYRNFYNIICEFLHKSDGE